jgi:hypothetical protein
MTIDELHQVPRERDLPPSALADRRDKLVRAIADEVHVTEPRTRTSRYRLRRAPRRSLALAFALVICGGLLAMPAFGLGNGALRLLGFNQPHIPQPPGQVARSLESDWRDDVAAGARHYPQEDFQNLPRSTFSDRLAEAGSKFGFVVEHVEFIRAGQDAPHVVVRTDDPSGLAQATPAILRSIDPKQPTGDDRTGWAYEGFFFEAKDANEVPFLITFNNWRGPHAGGGQWARSADLFPFEHLARAR